MRCVMLVDRKNALAKIVRDTSLKKTQIILTRRRLTDGIEIIKMHTQHSMKI